MAMPALSFEPVTKIDLSKVVMINITFNMGFGRLRQAKVKVVTDADSSLLRHQKVLLESDELDAIRSADGAMRRWIELKTVPSISEGVYTLPHALLVSVVERLEAYRDERQQLIDAFLARYTEQVSAARIALAEHFRENDYPSSETVAVNFGFDYAFQSVEVPAELQTIDSKIFQRAMQTQQKKFEAAGETIRTALRVSVADFATHLVDVLTPSADGKRKRLHDSTVTNLEEFLETFSFRNVTDDAALQIEVEKLKSIMHGVTPEKLRESENLKDKLAAQMSEASKILATLVIDAPTRRFR